MLLLLFVVSGTWCGSDDSNELLLFGGSALRRAFRTGADPGCEIGTNANAKGASAHTRRSGADFLVVESMLLGIPLWRSFGWIGRLCDCDCMCGTRLVST